MEVIDVTAVNVEVDVVASVLETAGTRGALNATAEEVVEELGGETVTTGWTVVVTVELTMHPTPEHEYPVMQHPPPAALGQLMSPAGQLDTCPPHICPSPQHPTSPAPELVMTWQVDPEGQQLFGRLIEVQTTVLPGHWNARCSREKLSLGDLSSRALRDWPLRFSKVWRAKGAWNG